MSSAELKQRLLQVIGSIPKGRVSTYGDIARMAGAPNHARFVGTLLKNLPTGSKIPWQRVINSKGEIAFPAGSDNWIRQQQRLLAEGVVLTGGKVSLRQYRWQP
ncbi:MGMT family protein [Ketobacter alkanivorans]|uniref:Cysteine methyltransferase n=1 Tax=Ketobacter alkanivorans TaxID=1917421 RepID=A0A2K9LPH3_9GAMM|nr:MGMT family protein [Ketobacter alkanivorans]AUM14130.1 cysteine methyltransferase [Ketobacter alkanivorans]MCP5017706.1 MGMT family protein [Ketobacter sp.]